MTADSVPAGDGGSMVRVPARPLCSEYDVALLDLDGVVYRGPHAVPGAAQALAAARGEGMQLAFLTNNASRTPEQIVEQLTGLGVTVTAEEVVTSAQAAARMVAQSHGRGARTFVVGGEGLRQAAREAGLELVDAYDVEPRPEVLLQGFSPDLRYEDLAQAALLVGRGAAWVATNTDSTLPTARGLQPGNGTLVAAVAAASGRTPEVAGKPRRGLVDETLRRTGARRPLMIGDRLDTDIEGAHVAGLDSLLVLTGVSSLAAVLEAGADQRPDYLAPDLSGLLEAGVPLTAAGVQTTGWSWQPAADGAVRLTPPDGTTPTSGDAPDSAASIWAGIRTLVVGVWAARDEGSSPTTVQVAGPWAAAFVSAGVPEDLMTAQEAS